MLPDTYVGSLLPSWPGVSSDIVEVLTSAGLLRPAEVVAVETPEVWDDAVVVIVRCTDRALIMKATTKGGGVRGEAAALRMAVAAGVPVPRVESLLVDPNAPGGAWLVEEFVDGEAGDDAPGRGRSPSWPAWLRGQSAEGLAALDPPRRRRAAAVLERGLSAIDPGDRPILAHGDLNPHELRHRNGALVAILDFGDALGADPIYDLAVIATGGPTLTLADRLLPHVLEGYQISAEMRAALRRLKPLYRLIGAVRNFAWSTRNRMSERMDGGLGHDHRPSLR
jgi:aminoglycoside phosphotransferase (APT) family kinase protein